MYYPPLPGPPSGPDDDDAADAPVWMLPMAVEIVTLAFQYLFLVVVFKLPYENWIDYGIAIYSIWLLAIGWQIYKLLDDSDVLSRGIKLLGWFLATVSLALAVAFWIRWDTEKSKVLEKKYESPASTNSRGDSVQPP